MYSRYAEVYDRSGQIQFSLRMIPYMEKLLEHHGWRGRSVLDLACGTGTLALSFAERGLRVIGVDASAEMLAQARKKAAEMRLLVEFRQQDMRELVLPEPVDLVTSCYDSLNYLLSVEDLTCTFTRVRESLSPGGLFAFDTNTIWLYESTDGDSSFSEVEGLAIFMHGAYERDTRLALAEVIGFVQRGGLYERFSETHLQRAYEGEEIERALTEAGLEKLACYCCFSFKPPEQNCPRYMWVARRPA